MLAAVCSIQKNHRSCIKSLIESLIGATTFVVRKLDNARVTRRKTQTSQNANVN
jgi:hypothetical protein